MRYTVSTTLAECYKQLVAKKAELTSALGADSREPLSGPTVVSEEDLAAGARDAFVETRLNDLDCQELFLVDAALERLASGTYGKCLGCGHAIGMERLRALPWASRCIACERQTAPRSLVPQPPGDRLARF